MTGIIVDLFAGGGGASTGLEAALGRPVTVAINHNPVAVAMHMAEALARANATVGKKL